MRQCHFIATILPESYREKGLPNTMQECWISNERYTQTNANWDETKGTVCVSFLHSVVFPGENFYWRGMQCIKVKWLAVKRKWKRRFSLLNLDMFHWVIASSANTEWCDRKCCLSLAENSPFGKDRFPGVFICWFVVKFKVSHTHFSSEVMSAWLNWPTKSYIRIAFVVYEHLQRYRHWFGATLEIDGQFFLLVFSSKIQYVCGWNNKRVTLVKWLMAFQAWLFNSIDHPRCQYMFGVNDGFCRFCKRIFSTWMKRLSIQFHRMDRSENP